jgi:uncharacterized protein YraI
MTMNNRWMALLLVVFLAGCGASLVETQDLNPVNEDAATTASALSGDLAFGTRLQTTADLNLRTGPSTSNAVRLTMPNGALVRVVRASPSSGWYNVNYQGTVGWASGSYLKMYLAPSGWQDEIVARGISVWGFSYQWGGGDWDPTSQSPGSCTGSCPDCTHSGTNGADCSGFVAKAWMVPPDNTPLTKAWHPYSTANFRDDSSSYWSTVSRSSTDRADALVYNSGGEGHVFLYTGGDAWGSMQAIECKGCSYGCLYNTRTASSAYVTIRKKI